MIKFIYEPTKATFANYEDLSPIKGITMELIDSVSWEEATVQFHNFLRSIGYVIPYDFEDVFCPECEMPYGNHKMDCSKGRRTHHE